MSARIAGLIVVAGVAIFATACGRPPEIEARADEITDVATLYGSNCAGCHGVDGRHGVGQPLNDATYLALVGEARLRDIITRGVPGTPMAAFGREAGGSLTSGQIAAIASGLTREWGRARSVDAAALPAYSEADARARGIAAGDPARGRAAFATYCARCHGDEGRGGTTAGSVVDRAYLSLTSDQAIRTAVIVGRADECATRQTMDDQEISDVVAWIASHRM
jgi:mono/diheme cytochrome c family protein